MVLSRDIAPPPPVMSVVEGDAGELPECLRHRLQNNARDEDRGIIGIQGSIDCLAEAGWLHAEWLTCCESMHVHRAVRSLMSVASANLPLARLLEGHANAIELIDRHAEPSIRSEVHARVREGALLGVWGADDGEPVSLDESSGRLRGSKRYASGIGLVSHAIVTARRGRAVSLCIVDVGEMAFADLTAWNMLGMKATVSGRYRLTDVPAASIVPFGPPDCFHQEPGLVGGVWRIAALQIGGVYGLVEAARTELEALNRLDDTAQIARLTPILYRAEAARHLVDQAAQRARGQAGINQPERAVAQSIFARLLTEELAQQAITAVERSVGLVHFDARSDSGRIARDLATYLRQVAPDAFLQRSGRETLCGSTELDRLFVL